MARHRHETRAFQLQRGMLLSQLCGAGRARCRQIGEVPAVHHRCNSRQDGTEVLVAHRSEDSVRTREEPHLIEILCQGGH